MIKSLLAGDIRTLAKAITLVESNSNEKRATGLELLCQAMNHIPTNRTTRLAISGPPGVGKSCLIESLGTQLLSEDASTKIAVLAVDPSSPKTNGSILGDKTRMHTLASHPRVFIRPSPSGINQNGLNSMTRESILLCEAAGFNLIIVETVGVGQSAISCTKIVDTTVLLQQPFGGDELQGSKKGLLELADIIAVTKADGPTKVAAEIAAREFHAAYSILPGRHCPQIFVVSSQDNSGIDSLATAILKRSNQDATSTAKLRQKQNREWFYEECHRLLAQKLDSKIQESSNLKNLLADIDNLKKPASWVAKQAIAGFFDV